MSAERAALRTLDSLGEFVMHASLADQEAHEVNSGVVDHLVAFKDGQVLALQGCRRRYLECSRDVRHEPT